MNIYIEHSRVDFCVFRINIYDNSEGLPDEKINTENIVIKTPIIKSDWNVIDLLKYNLAFNDEFYVSVEFIPDFKTNEAYQLNYGGKRIKRGNVYIRKSSMGEWTSIFFNASFNVDVIY